MSNASIPGSYRLLLIGILALQLNCSLASRVNRHKTPGNGDAFANALSDKHNHLEGCDADTCDWDPQATCSCVVPMGQEKNGLQGSDVRDTFLNSLGVNSMDLRTLVDSAGSHKGSWWWKLWKHSDFTTAFASVGWMSAALKSATGSAIEDLAVPVSTLSAIDLDAKLREMGAGGLPKTIYTILVDVWDSDLTSNDFLGQTGVALQAGEHDFIDMPLENNHKRDVKERATGTVTFSTSFNRGGDLVIKCISAAGLRNADAFSLSDPYCKVRVKQNLEDPSQKFKSNVVSNNLNPKWDNAESTFTISGLWPAEQESYWAWEGLSLQEQVKVSIFNLIEVFMGELPQACGGTLGKKKQKKCEVMKKLDSWLGQNQDAILGAEADQATLAKIAEAVDADEEKGDQGDAAKSLMDTLVASSLAQIGSGGWHDHDYNHGGRRGGNGGGHYGGGHHGGGWGDGGYHRTNNYHNNRPCRPVHHHHGRRHHSRNNEVDSDTFFLIVLIMAIFSLLGNDH